MRPLILMSAVLIIAFVPLAQASCHTCMEAVVEDCTESSPNECVGSAAHAATHLPEHASEIARDPEGYTCDTLDCP